MSHACDRFLNPTLKLDAFSGGWCSVHSIPVQKAEQLHRYIPALVIQHVWLQVEYQHRCNCYQSKKLNSYIGNSIGDPTSCVASGMGDWYHAAQNTEQLTALVLLWCLLVPRISHPGPLPAVAVPKPSSIIIVDWNLLQTLILSTEFLDWNQSLVLVLHFQMHHTFDFLPIPHILQFIVHSLQQHTRTMVYELPRTLSLR